MEDKTNVMRMFDKHKLPYTSYSYEQDENTTGEEVAARLGMDPASVFKTLVTVGASREHYVFVIPVTGELDLKKAAKAVGEKSIQMVKSKELLPLTGYIHGGCSPVGMKKLFKNDDRPKRRTVCRDRVQRGQARAAGADFPAKPCRTHPLFPRRPDLMTEPLKR